MSFEKGKPIDNLENKKRFNATHVEISHTPLINTNVAGTGTHEEAHRTRRLPRELPQESLEKIRDEILEHYGVESSRALSLEDGMRDIRAFVLLKGRENSLSPGCMYFADGQKAHADLLLALFNKFPETGGTSNGALPKDILENWEVKKGFIDPNFNQFHGFSDIRSAFRKTILEEKKEELSEEEMREIERDEVDLPNWFLIG
ncbi:MAG: hypothetical protein NTY93_01385 [Candidatus Kaiserbacteria bacterium]|nr:hypothetical protein [Candidatus Kaiserbacteria bacterium]